MLRGRGPEWGKGRSLVLWRGYRGVRFAWLLLALVIGLGVVVKLLLIPGASGEVCGMFATAVDAFRWYVDRFCTVLCGMGLVTFDTSRGFTTIIRRMAEGLAVEALSHWTGVF